MRKHRCTACDETWGQTTALCPRHQQLTVELLQLEVYTFPEVDDAFDAWVAATLTVAYHVQQGAAHA